MCLHELQWFRLSRLKEQFLLNHLLCVEILSCLQLVSTRFAYRVRRVTESCRSKCCYVNTHALRIRRWSACVCTVNTNRKYLRRRVINITLWRSWRWLRRFVSAAANVIAPVWGACLYSIPGNADVRWFTRLIRSRKLARKSRPVFP